MPLDDDVELRRFVRERRGAGVRLSEPIEVTTPDAIAPVASIVIPAHNEERVIGRLLRSLTTGVPSGHSDIVVVCNGCTRRYCR